MLIEVLVMQPRHDESGEMGCRGKAQRGEAAGHWNASKTEEIRTKEKGRRGKNRNTCSQAAGHLNASKTEEIQTEKKGRKRRGRPAQREGSARKDE
jgi:hypothetical protein